LLRITRTATEVSRVVVATARATDGQLQIIVVSIVGALPALAESIVVARIRIAWIEVKHGRLP
jgi:hypothetical protein